MIRFIKKSPTRFINESNYFQHIFNIFSNDLLLLLEKKCHVFYYAEDTSVLCKHRDYESVYNDVLSAASTMTHWY